MGICFGWKDPIYWAADGMDFSQSLALEATQGL